MWLIINQMLSRAACFHLTDINHLIIISPIPAPIMVFIQLYVFYLTAWILLNSESLCKTISTSWRFLISLTFLTNTIFTDITDTAKYFFKLSIYFFIQNDICLAFTFVFYEDKLVYFFAFFIFLEKRCPFVLFDFGSISYCCALAFCSRCL